MTGNNRMIRALLCGQIGALEQLHAQGQRGKAAHVSSTPLDIFRAVATLPIPAAASNYNHEIEIHAGHNRLRQANFFDPDHTSTGLKEPFTIDGKPRLPLTAPLPR